MPETFGVLWLILIIVGLLLFINFFILMPFAIFEIRKQAKRQTELIREQVELMKR